MRIFSSKIPFLSHLQILLFGSIFFITGISSSFAYQYKNLDDGWMYSTDPIKFLSGSYTLGPVAIGYTGGSINPAYKLDVVGGYINTSSGLCINGDCKTSWSGFSPWIQSGTKIYYMRGKVGIGESDPQYPLSVGPNASSENNIIDDSFEDQTLDPFQDVGSAPWIIASSGARTGGYGLVGTAYSNLNSLSIEVSLSQPGFVEFWVKTSIGFPGESNMGYFTRDNWNTSHVLANDITEMPWTRFSYSLPAGTHTLGWEFEAWDPSNFIFIDDIRVYEVSRNISLNLQGDISINNIPFAGYKTTNDSLWIGNNALQNIVLGVENIAIGSGALSSVTGECGEGCIGSYNIAIGSRALYETVNGRSNIAIGNDALSINQSSNNIAIGQWSLGNNTDGHHNVAIGDDSMAMNVNGNQNTAIGVSALRNNEGTDNVGVGYYALGNVWGSSSFDHSTAVGSFAGFQQQSGGDNSFFGHSAGYYNTSGLGNAFFGSNAGYFQEGSENSFFGNEAGNGGGMGASANGNSFFGYRSGYKISTGNFNVLMGRFSGFNLTSGAGNTMIGTEAGSGIQIGLDNTFIGRNANTLKSSLDNTSAIGANAFVRVSNTMVLGSVNGVNGATSDVQVVMGSGAASSGVYRLDVQKGYINSSSGLCINGDCKSDWSQVGYTSMQLTSNNSSTPANCPSGWTEADYQTTVYSAGNWNRVRTCFIHEEYEIMQLPSDGTPANCPSGWTEVDYKAQSSGFTTNNVRTCIIKG